MGSSGRRHEFFAPERVLAFSDGVFAVAITLLVLDVRLPAAGPDRSDAALLNDLFELGPKLAVFCFSFIIIGINWLGHHRKFSYIERVDGRLMWLNLIYLMGLCLVPFATSVLSDRNSRLGIIVYVSIMALVTFLSAGVSAYGLRQIFVGAAELPPGVRQDMILPPLFSGGIFLITAALAYANEVGVARWMPLTIFPVLALLEARSRRRP